MDRTTRVTYAVSSFAFVLLSFGVVSAYSSPATGYELSIYSGTPIVYWLSLAVSLFVTVFLLLSKNRNKTVGLTLGSVAIASLLCLPIIRGYYHVGATDALSHWAIAQEVLQSGDIVGWQYPALHVGTATWSLVTGQSPNTVIFLLAAIYGLTFPLFVYLSVRRLDNGKQRAKYIGFLSAILFLPINQIGVRIEAHPTSQAVLYLPVIIFVTILYYDRLQKRASILLLPLVSFYIYLHPQQAANLILLLGLLSVTLLVLDSDLGGHPIQSDSYRHFPTIATGFLFWVLMSFREFFIDQLQNSVGRFVQLTGRGTETVEGRANSIEAVGGSFEEIVLKLFLVAAVFCGLYAVNAVILGKSLNDIRKDTPDFELALTVGILTVVGMVATYLIGGISDQFARHLGFVMVVVTILGSLCLARLYSMVEPKLGGRRTRNMFVLFFVCCLLLSTPIVFASDYIYRGSGHVPESQVSGYETAFEHYDVDQPIIHARSPAYRYATVTTGIESETAVTLEQYDRDEIAPAPVHFDNQSLHRDTESLYVGVVEADISRDADLYNGFRFSHDDFRYVENHPRINKVVTNDQFQLYHSPGESDDTTLPSSTNVSAPADG